MLNCLLVSRESNPQKSQSNHLVSKDTRNLFILKNGIFQKNKIGLFCYTFRPKGVHDVDIEQQNKNVLTRHWQDRRLTYIR